ncbi:anaphase-promoting complex subunit 4-like [Mercenaria mercenaria]|uniref:anaphase-promoting complex subunit 4-like n=1 Tax=Mercenaria mercenaria TaxID=6596 RepID=UPI00234EAE6D|nr:anaphase-promoting complex subunit 4-like [Mercenaria mercenaria]
MPDQGAFRQVDEKHVAVEVELMVWSPKFDLVALSNVQGEVVLHRLSWQKVWSLPPHSEEVKVKAMSWRPDGKVLAVGYTSGQVNLCYIENAEVLHTIQLEKEITCLSWVCQVLPGGGTWSCDPYAEDNTELYLPKLQPLTKSYGSLSKGNVEENVEDKKKLKGQKELNILIIGSKSHELQLYIYGVFPVAKISIRDISGSERVEMVSAMLSEDLNSLALVLQQEHEEDMEYTLHTFDTSLLASHDKELHLLALKYGQIATLIQASGAGTVSNDFLELLLFGTPSSELQTFLSHELTDKGLKKLGHSIETSYSNIQKLVVKHLQTVSQAIVYHLSELKGMSKCYEKFGVLGVDEKTIHKALMASGSFVLKTSELQQVIDGSIKNFKAFFRWLYVVILRLSDEKPPPELSKMTQHDVNFVADFLTDNFAQFTPREEEESIEDLRAVSPTDKKPGFKLEKVGQYLKKENLSYPADISNNPWIQFCRANYSLKDSKILYPVETNKSLIQLQEALEHDIYHTLHKPAVTVGQTLQSVSTMFLFSAQAKDENGKHFIQRTAQFTAGQPSLLYTAFTAEFLPCDKLYILTQPTNSYSVSENMRITSVKFSCLTRPDPNSSSTSTDSTQSSSGSLSVLDIACYDDKHLSVLLAEDTDDRTPVLMQLPLDLITEENFITVSGTAGVNTRSDIPVLEVTGQTENLQYRWLQNMKAHSFAVSGTRHTATVLFSSRRRVRIFLMDAEEDEDDEDEVDGADITSQSEIDQSAASNNDISQSACSSQDTSQSGVSMQIEDSVMDGDDGQEDKENSSGLIDSGEQSGS